MLFHLAVAGVRLRNPLRGLLLFAGGHCAGQVDGVVGHVHVDVVAAQSWLVTQSILNLALKVATR